MRSLLAALVMCVSASALAGGTVTGKVAFSGPAPKAEKLDVQSDPACAKGAPEDETILPGKDGKTLQNVVVRIVNAPAASAPPTTPIVIDQQGCVYRPRVSGAVTGQQVMVRNSDGTMHNVRASLGKKTVLNRAQPPGAKEINTKAPTSAGDVMQLKCDVHPWMLAHVVVNPTPYFAVTGADGGFELKDVPAGTWKIEAWHEKFGTKTGEIKVEDGKPATLVFSYP
jgi:plastocyanin